MRTFKTEQEEFWAGAFGDQYVQRNNDKKIVAGNIALFSKVFKQVTNINSVIEFGANIGLNLRAINQLLPEAKLSAIEINGTAAGELNKLGEIKVYNKSILEFEPDHQRDFVLIKGVLIHINPDELPKVYERLYQTSSRYICVAEYYNPSPVAIDYRGHQNRLFKRDFAGEILDKYPDLKLVDYGFVYRRDNLFPLDDITWFLLEKTGK